MTSFNAVSWLLDRHVEAGRGEAACFHTGDRVYRYADVLDRVARAAGRFAEAGVEAGDRVLVCLPDTVDAAVLVLAAVRIGAVAVPLSPRLKPADYERVIADARPAAAVVAAALDWLAGPLECHTGGRQWLDAPAPVTGWRWLAAGTPPAAGAAPTDAEDAALIQYTSGSTGEPRGVVHRHRALRFAPAGLIERVGVEPADVIFSASKMAFGYGLGNSVLVPMSVGASSVLISEPVEPAVVARTLTRHRPTLLFAVPTLYAALLGAGDPGRRFPIGDCRAYVSSGEHLSAGLGSRCRDAFGPGLVDVFGCTETLYSFAGNAPGQWRPGSIGEPFTGYELRLVPDHEATGELWVRGPGVAAGYWGRPDRTAETFQDGWVRTGDSMRRLADGRLGHLGRNDDVIKVGGLKVAPAEIEDVLLAHPAVAACAVVGQLDADGLTTVTAFVVRSAEAGPDCAGDLRRHLRERLTPQRRPARVEFVEELPTTSTGKTSRHLLRHSLTASTR